MSLTPEKITTPEAVADRLQAILRRARTEEEHGPRPDCHPADEHYAADVRYCLGLVSTLVDERAETRGAFQALRATLVADRRTYRERERTRDLEIERLTAERDDLLLERDRG